jgi:O-antigen/teichoic acid export membrane protein
MAGSVLGALLGFVLVRWRIARPRLRIDLARWGPLMRAALPVGISALSVTVLARIDMAILAVYEPDEIVGRYGAAYRVFESTLFVGWSVTAAFLPVLSRITRDSTPPLGRVFERGMKLVPALSLPLAVGTLVLAEPIIRTLFGDQYAGGAGALRILAPAMTLAAASYLASHLLIARDRQVTMAWIYGLIAVENVAANFVLIPLLSLEGAALNTTLSELLIVAALLAVGSRIAGPFDWMRMFAGPVAAAGACAGAMLVLRDTPAGAAAAGAVAYVAVLWAVERFAYPDDVAQVRSLVAFRPRARPSSGA